MAGSPSDSPSGAAGKPDAASAAVPGPWLVAVVLAGGAIAGTVVIAVAAAGVSAAVTAAAVAVAAVAAGLLVVLGWLRRRYRLALAEAAWDAAGARQRAADLEARAGQEQTRLAAWQGALSGAVDHLLRVQLPAALRGGPVPPSAAGAEAGGAGAWCGQVAEAVAGEVGRLREELEGERESARLAVVALARRVQASAHRIQEEATAFADRRPADPDALEVSMRVDHSAAQQARHAQSMAVLCGEWPGQQWPQPLPLVDVVRAAAGRIVPYQRVAVTGEADTGAAAAVVEPLIHVVAELLANAAQSSAPSTQVLVTVRTVQRGAVIEIDDCGVGMEEHRLEQARQVASGQRPMGLAELGEIPQTGLPVVGQYARRHGLRVDLAPSPYGGVRAVVLVPAAMLETLDDAIPPAAGAQQPVPGQAGEAVLAGGRGLPQRRSPRGHPGPAAPAASPAWPSAGDTAPAVAPEQAGRWMGAFLASADGRHPAADGTNGDGRADAVTDGPSAGDGDGDGDVAGS